MFVNILINLLFFKKSLLTFLFYILLVTYYTFWFFPFFLIFLIFWLIKLNWYIFNTNITFFSPNQLNIKGSYIRQYLFLIFIIKPYLLSYNFIYTLLKTKFEHNKKITINVELLIIFFKNLLIRIFFGVSVSIYKQAKNIRKQAINIMSLNSNNKIELFFFNLLMIDLTTINRLEKSKIYKESKNLFKFNPSKEIITKFISKHFPRIELLWPETVTEKIIGQIIVQGIEESKYEATRGFISFKGIKQMHEGILHTIGEKEQGANTIGINTTSQEQTFESKNFPFDEKSYLTQPMLLDKSQLEINVNNPMTDLSDSRARAQVLNLHDLALISSLGFSNHKFLMYTKDFKKAQLVESSPKALITTLKKKVEYFGGQPNKSSIYEIERKLKQALEALPDVNAFTQQNAIAYAIAELCSNENYFNMIYDILEKK